MAHHSHLKDAGLVSFPVEHSGYTGWKIRIQFNSSICDYPVWLTPLVEDGVFSSKCVKVCCFPPPQNSGDYRSVGLYVGPQSYAIDQYVCLHGQYVCLHSSTMLFSLLWICSMSWNLEQWHLQHRRAMRKLFSRHSRTVVHVSSQCLG